MDQPSRSFSSLKHGQVYSGKSRTFQTAEYLLKTVENSKEILLGLRFVNVWTKENTQFEIDNTAIELLNHQGSHHVREGLGYNHSMDGIHSEEQAFNDSDAAFGDKIEITQRVDKILSIASDTQRFVLVGAPGAGKTTTLRKVMLENARKILQQVEDVKIPVFVAAKRYSRAEGKDFEVLIAESLSTDLYQAVQLLQAGKLQIMVDGVNEIPATDRMTAFNELNDLLDFYEGCAFIITTRKYGFKNAFGIQEFEIKELQETEIREFIAKHSPENAEEVWAELSSNKQVFPLASNPLMLFMIVVAAQHKQTSLRNKAELFDHFVEQLLRREYAISHEDQQAAVPVSFEDYLQSRLHILGEFSHYMKESGKVSTAKTSLDFAFQNEAIYLIFKDLLQSPLLTDYGQAVSFSHETFLDYFAGKSIYERFVELSTEKNQITPTALGISDPYSQQWFEPFLLCGEMLANQLDSTEKALELFEFLFRGKTCHEKWSLPFKVPAYQRQSNGKHSVHIRLEDLMAHPAPLHEDILAACKLAYHLKERFPEVFTQAEWYVRLYLRFYVTAYDHNHQLMPLEKLLNAVAALSSPTLLELVFFDTDWQEIWLYESNFDRYVADSFVKNVSDFEACLILLDNKEKTTPIFWGSIRDYLFRIKTNLLSGTSLNALKNVFLNNPPELQLLSFIGKIDVDFFVAHYNLEAWGLDDFLDFLYPRANFLGVRSVFLRFIESGLLPNSVKLEIFRAFTEGPHFREILPYMAKLWQNSDQALRDGLMELWFSIPFYQLSPEIQKILEQEFRREDRSYISFLDLLGIKTPENRNFRLQSNGIDAQMADSFLGSKSIEISGKEFGLVNKQLFIGAELTRFSKAKNYPEGTFFTVFFEIAVQAEDTALIMTSTTLQISGYSLIIEGLKYATIGKFVLSPSIPISRLIHPYFFQTNTEFLNKIEEQLLEDDWRKQFATRFVKALRIQHKYHHLLSNVKYYLYLSKYGEMYFAYGIQDKKLLSFSMANGEVSQVDKIAVLEEDGSLRLIDDQESLIPQIGYQTSQIIRVDAEKTEGHIRNNSAKRKELKEKDYYYVFNDCNFRPKLGDVVQYLPAINTRLTAKGLPKAYRVHKVGDAGLCRIKSVIFVEGEDPYFHGFALDEEKMESIYYRIYLNLAYKIENYTGYCVPGMLCQYFVLHYAEIYGTQSVSICSVLSRKCRITELVSNSHFSETHYAGYAEDIETSENLYFKIPQIDMKRWFELPLGPRIGTVFHYSDSKILKKQEKCKIIALIGLAEEDN